jgi:iron complex outermembrane recepter protein
MRTRLLSLAVLALPAWGQDRATSTVPAPALDAVVVTGARDATPRQALPAAIDTVPAEAIVQDQLRVNVSDALARVPGLVANNRQNYAQDLQVSIRGFGARASFGVRGVRLLQDGIPLTTPDGQGQTGLFDLDGAQRIEVLRGPLAVLYGNSSGGVVQLFSDLDPGDAHLGGGLWFGEDGAWRSHLQARSDLAGGRGVVAANVARFETDGYREHSATRRDSLNLRSRTVLGEHGTLTLLFNHLDQPRTQDPLGLTEAQLRDDRRQAGTNALAFDTRKTVRHSQAGAALTTDLDAGHTLRLSAYGGTRTVRQYLAFPGSGATASGGVVDLDRTFGGAGLEWQARRGDWLWIAGLDHDRSEERRQGFVNNNGTAGDPRRDEDNTATSTDARVQVRWTLQPGWTVVSGLRHSRVAFDIDDAYITPDNPDDSGSRRFRSTSAMLGLNVEWHPGWAGHVSVGRGFETPTLAEVAYRPDAQPGTNLALDAARHTTWEAGLKAALAHGHTASLTVFDTRVRDEIVIFSNVGGRSTFVNAGRTSRRGLEAAWQARWSAQWDSTLALTWLRARFDEFSTGSTDHSGQRLPGVPERTALAALSWRPAPAWRLTAQWRGVSQVWANDANTASAPGHGVVNLSLGHEKRHGPWQLDAFARVDNVGDKHHVGSVIVNANNAQFYEPAPGRRASVGVSLRRDWP